MRRLRALPGTVVLGLFPLLVVALTGVLLWRFALAVDTDDWLWSLLPALLISWTADGIRRTLRRRPDPADDVVLERDDAPDLWAVVDDVATTLDTPPFTQIVVLPEDLMGSDARDRTLALGLPLLAAFTTGHLRAVLAHEFAHLDLDHADGPAHRHLQRLAAAGADSTGPVRLLALLVLALHAVVTGPDARRAERLADTWCLRVATREETFDALVTTARAHLLWEPFDAVYLDTFHAAGLRTGITRAFAAYLADTGDTLVRHALPDTLAARTRLTDTHPAIRDRIDTLHDLPAPEGAATTRDDRPAIDLVPDDTLLAVEERLLVSGPHLHVTDLDTAIHIAATSALIDNARDIAADLGTDAAPVRTYDDILAAVERTDASFLSGPVAVPLVSPVLIGRLAGDDPDADPLDLLLEQDDDVLTQVGAAALLETTDTRVVMAPPGYALHRADGSLLDLPLVLVDHRSWKAGITALRSVLTAEGARLDVTPGSIRPPAAHPLGGTTRILGPWDGERDLVVLPTALVALPAPHLPRTDDPVSGDEQDRLVIWLSHTPDALSAQPDAWTLPTDRITSARLTGRLLTTVHIHTTDGEEIRLHPRLSRSEETPGLRDVLRTVLGHALTRP